MLRTSVVGHYHWTSLILPSIAFVGGIALLVSRGLQHQGPNLFDAGIAFLVLYDVFLLWRTLFPFSVSTEDGQILFRGKNLKPAVKCRSVIRLDSSNLTVKFNPLIMVKLEGIPELIDDIERSFLLIKYEQQ